MTLDVRVKNRECYFLSLIQFGHGNVCIQRDNMQTENYIFSVHRELIEFFVVAALQKDTPALRFRKAKFRLTDATIKPPSELPRVLY